MGTKSANFYLHKIGVVGVGLKEQVIYPYGFECSALHPSLYTLPKFHSRDSLINQGGCEQKRDMKLAT